MKNKFLIIIGILVIVFVLFFLIFKQKEATNNTAPTIPVSLSDENLKKISFNNIRIGDKIQNKMKNLVMDASYLYSYNNININVDKDDNITYLGVNSHYSIDDKGNKINEFLATKDAKIEYQNKKLETISDFIDIFGEGSLENKEEDNDYYSIIYKSENMKLELYIIEGKIYNINLKIHKE